MTIEWNSIVEALAIHAAAVKRARQIVAKADKSLAGTLHKAFGEGQSGREAFVKLATEKGMDSKEILSVVRIGWPLKSPEFKGDASAVVALVAGLLKEVPADQRKSAGRFFAKAILALVK